MTLQRAHNATERKTLFWLFRDLSSTHRPPTPHRPTSIVTAVWHSVSKHHICCVLLRAVNNTDGSARPQSISRDGGTSNTTAAAALVTQTCRSPPPPPSYAAAGAVPACSHNYTCMCQCVSHMTLPLTELNTHGIPCVRCLFLHMAAVVCYHMRDPSNVKRIVALWQWVGRPWVEGSNTLYPA